MMMEYREYMMKNLSESECFALLANHHRRIALRVLRDTWCEKLENHTRKTNGLLPMQQLAELIAQEEYDNPSEDEICDIRIVLHHTHLPRLEDADVISYNQVDKTIELRPNFDTLHSFLEQMTGREDVWTNS